MDIEVVSNVVVMTACLMVTFTVVEFFDELMNFICTLFNNYSLKGYERHDKL